jgi:hypothetical protein
MLILCPGFFVCMQISFQNELLFYANLVPRTGRCYYGQESARKIAYPEHFVHYFLSDITRGGLNDIEGVLDTDFLYFDSQRDVELAKVLQRMAMKEAVMQRPTTGYFPESHPLC